MVTLRYWLRDGASGFISAPQFGSAMDDATRIGAYRVQDELGSVLCYLWGEWVFMPDKEKDQPQDPRANERRAR